MSGAARSPASAGDQEKESGPCAARNRREWGAAHVEQREISRKGGETRMQNVAYYNGKIAPIEEMMVPMNDRACYFGDGVYDATGVVNHVPMALDEHIDRIYRSAGLIEIEIPMEKAEMKRILLDLVSRVEGDVHFLYWQITRGVGMRGHAYSSAGKKPSLWAFVRPSTMRDPYGAYTCITVEDKRFFYCNIKTINLLPAVMANEHAERAGCDEAIFHRGERVTECSHSNVHIIKDGVLKTAPCDELILPGITRAHILAICRREGIPVVEEPFTLREMMEADEVFFSSSSALTSRVVKIDGRPVGGKDEATFARIRDAYQLEMKRECGLL